MQFISNVCMRTETVTQLSLSAGISRANLEPNPDPGSRKKKIAQ